MREYEPPARDSDGFNCPHCGIYAQQHWRPLYSIESTPRSHGLKPIDGLARSICGRCGQYNLWLSDEMVYPFASTAPLPSPDMPVDVAADFREARDVLARSPRSAAALLRLALQKLMKHMNVPGENLNDDIAALVKKGLRSQVQQALDIVRVTGNNAVHPGELDVRDDFDTATTLFKLVNLIVEQMITTPREIQDLYGSLPERARQAIERRDAKPDRNSRT